LHDLFLFLNYQDEQGERWIVYSDFIDKLQLEGKDVSERSVFRVEKQLKLLEQDMDKRLDRVVEELTQSVACILDGMDRGAIETPTNSKRVRKRSRSF